MSTQSSNQTHAKNKIINKVSGLKSTFRGGWSWVEAARNETELLESMQNTISACDSCAAAITSTWNHMLSLVEGYHLPDLVYLCLLFISVLAMSSIVIGSEISVAFKFRGSLSLSCSLLVFLILFIVIF
jgi:hypothetical protein